MLHKEGWVTSSESKTIKGSNFQDEILLPVNRYNQQIFLTKHEIIDRNRIKMYYRMYHNPIVRMTSSRIEHRAWIEFQI